MIKRTIARLILVPLGFVLAVIATGFVLVTLGAERVTHAMHGKEADFSQLGQVWTMLGDFKSLAQLSTLALPVLIVIVGEVARIRSSVYYIVGGGAALGLLPLVMRSTSLGEGLAHIGLIWQVFATAGFVGGFVYWLIAGRGA